MASAKAKSKKSRFVIVKEKPHEFYPKKPSNMSFANWNALFKPRFEIKFGSMVLYRESTLKKAQATKKWLEREWEKGEKKSKVKTKKRRK
jgi:hypothetical protein